MAASTTLPADPTLEEIRAALAPAIAANAAFDGWKDAAVCAAAELHGLDPAIAAVAFKGGAAGMIDAWFAHVDAEMVRRLPAELLANMPIRQRITALVEARLAILAPEREALRRALAVLAFPTHAPLAARLGWRAADAMWRLAGDTATDFNHYSKRVTLGAVYASTLAVFLDDETDDSAETRAFLARRIEDVMRIEKAKAQWRARRPMRFSPARFLGRLRYPAR